MSLMMATLMGCAQDPAGPQPEQPIPWQVSSMPLAVGNSWTYAVTFHVDFLRPNGTKAREPRHLDASATREIISTETIDGREYVVEEFITYAEDEPTLTSWRRLRQDEDAVYQANVSASVPPGEVPPGATVHDKLLLELPVTDGATWSLPPENPSAIYTVEEKEELPLAIGETEAWRIRIEYAGDGPDDYTTRWYGVEGLLRREAHTEFDASDATGDVIHVVTHTVEELAAVDLVE